MGHIALGQIVDRTAEWDSDSLDAMTGDLVIGERIDRYRRTWIVARYTTYNRDLFGKIGFQSSSETNEVFDEATGEFLNIASKTGASAPFVIKRRTGRIGFQIRPGIFDRRVLCSALESILNKTAGQQRWSVEPDLVPTTWERWIAGVSRLNHLQITLEEPNPNWSGRPHIEPFVEDTNAEYMRMVLKAHDDGAGLNVGAEVVREAIDHVQRGYGRIIAEGEGTTARRFNSEDKEARAEVVVPLEPQQKDVRPVDLSEAADTTAPENPATPRS